MTTMMTLRILLFACLLTAGGLLLFTLLHISVIRSRSPKKDSIRPIIIPAEQKKSYDDCVIDCTGCPRYHYEYEPDWLPLPDGATVEHAHGIYVSGEKHKKIIITYQDKVDESKCLLEWKMDDLTVPGKFLGPGASLCAGVPHGLSAIVDNGYDDEEEKEEEIFLYHANNDQRLCKTRLDGSIVWSQQHNPPDPNSTFRPTWIAGQPNSEYIYLADGYGSSRIYLLYKSNGTYTGTFFGGIGQEDGYFKTSHGISWDWRFNQMIVCDRENHRLQYFEIDPIQPNKFQMTAKQSFADSYHLYRPCNVRFHPTTKQAIVPFLEGTVAIFKEPSDDPHNEQVESILNITQQLGHLGFLHPHDAHFLPNGDFVLVTWNPGRIGYFRRVGHHDHHQTTTTTGESRG